MTLENSTSWACSSPCALPASICCAEAGALPREIALRKEVAEMYPSREFLTMAQSAGVPLVISSDAHAPGEVGADFDKAVALAREVGYTQLATFDKRQRGSIDLPEI